ncbi:Hemin uptake protein hemP [Planctomycetes bacterium Pan216]|uniref:Hemin uptake protein hemP n=1 Tax=Kolteria novifilia TaxID=2527975 RepID=A0A518BCR1_9BACT|nr:Hemin uptake protein hemP [Planctomycetes bacterium Pan216]
MTHSNQFPESHPDKPESAPAAPLVRSEDLMARGRELLILHGNDVYRLRVTKQNKLILTK